MTGPTPLCPSCGQPGSQGLAGATPGWECRNEACPEYGQPIRAEDPPLGGYRAAAIDELPTLWDGFAKLVRAGLGIEAFGVNIMDLPPGHRSRSHDEADSGQQELYVALRGSGAVEIGGERLPLDPDHLICVDAGTARVLSSGPEGLRVLCVGGVPGAAYPAAEWSSAGESPT